MHKVTGVTPHYASLGMVLILVLSLSAFTCNQNSYVRTAQLAKDFAATVLAVQQGVTAAHQNGYVNDRDYQTFQTKVSQLADAGMALDKAISQSHSASGALAQITVIRGLLSDLSTNQLAGIKNDNAKLAVQALLLTAQTTIDNIAAFGGNGGGQ